MSLRRYAAAVVASLGVLVGGIVAPARASQPRGYEMVSPPDKNGGDITGNGLTAQAAASGDAIAYASRGSFGDTIGSGVAGMTQYVARRGAAGWTSTGVTPTPQYDAPSLLAGVTALLTFSDDVRRGVVWAYDLPAVTGEAAPAPNVYSEDTLTRALRLVSIPLAGPVPFSVLVNDFHIPNVAGVSGDARHIAFAALSHLLPDAPADVPSVYEWDDGTLRLASILPDGTVPAGGAVLASPTAAQQTYRQTVSPDGTRVLFLSPPVGGQLYARVDHARTVWISQPETSGPSGPPANVMLQQVTGDSRHVVFSTTSRLLDGDANSGNDLYLYTATPGPASDANLTLVTSTGDVPAQPVVVGSSDDGSRIYYYQGEQLRLWSGGATRVVASGVMPVIWPGLTEETGFAAATSTPGGARVTPDGRYLAFWTRSAVVAGGPHPLIGDAGGHAALYLYDADEDQLRCVSCPADGTATDDASIVPNVTDVFPRLWLPGIRPSFLASDGSVFFSTDEPLVQGDVNGVTDAYQFDPASGETSLVSTGTGSEPAAFVDASASGADVFIVTRQRLRKADRDAFADLYDARTGTVFPDAADPRQPCEGDACQGAPSPPPGEAAIGSAAFDGGARAHGPAGRLRAPRSRTIVGWHGALRIVVPARGSLRWAGRGLRPGARAFGGSGATRIRIALTSRARTRLARHGAARARLRLTFLPADGPPAHASVTLRFTRRSKRGASR